MITKRLDLRLGTRQSFEIAIDDRASLARTLDANVPDTWPVEHYDDGVREWCLNMLDADPNTPWLLRYIIERETNTVVGTCGGFKPDEKTVTVGYSILPDYRRRGYATEATLALIELAFSNPAVERVVADTYPELDASIGVMKKCGMTYYGPGDDEGTIRYELKRRC